MELKVDAMPWQAATPSLVSLVMFEEEDQYPFVRPSIALRAMVRTGLNPETLSPLTVPCSLFPVP